MEAVIAFQVGVPPAFEPKPCPVCGSRFSPQHVTQGFCSEECRRVQKAAYDKARYIRGHRR